MLASLSWVGDHRTSMEQDHGTLIHQECPQQTTWFPTGLLDSFVNAFIRDQYLHRTTYESQHAQIPIAGDDHSQ